jgi:hypothetical protein
MAAMPLCLESAVQRAVASDARVEIHDGPMFHVAQQDNDPPPTPPAEPSDPAAGSESPGDCQPFDLEPLTSLTVDITPIGRTGQIVLTDEKPVDCFSYAMGELPTIYVGWDGSQPTCDLLNVCCGWQFCHRPLYFEERCLERYGSRTCCCQPGASALHFYGTALLLPIKMLQQPCCRASVLTPCY